MPNAESRQEAFSPAWWPECSHICFLSTTALREFILKNSLSNQSLCAQELNVWANGADGDLIPYKVLRNLWSSSREAGLPFSFEEITASSSLILPSLKPIQKSKELEGRLEKIKFNLEVEQYSKLVKDVTRAEQSEKERVFMGTYKQQLGFGMHVLVIMFVGYVMGHVAFQSQFPDQPALHALGGVSGLVIGMLVEVLLFIIRSEQFEVKQKKMNQQDSSRPIGGQSLFSNSSKSSNGGLDSTIPDSSNKKEIGRLGLRSRRKTGA